MWIIDIPSSLCDLISLYMVLKKGHQTTSSMLQIREFIAPFDDVFLSTLKQIGVWKGIKESLKNT